MRPLTPKAFFEARLACMGQEGSGGGRWFASKDVPRSFTRQVALVTYHALKRCVHGASGRGTKARHFVQDCWSYVSE